MLLSEPIKAKDGSGDLAQLVQGMGGVVSVQEEQGKRVGEAATARARTRKKKKGGGTNQQGTTVITDLATGSGSLSSTARHICTRASL